MIARRIEYKGCPNGRWENALINLERAFLYPLVGVGRSRAIESFAFERSGLTRGEVTLEVLSEEKSAKFAVDVR